MLQGIPELAMKTAGSGYLPSISPNISIGTGQPQKWTFLDRMPLRPKLGLSNTAEAAVRESLREQFPRASIDTLLALE